jgi:signal peptidase I
MRNTLLVVGALTVTLLAARSGENEVVKMRLTNAATVMEPALLKGKEVTINLAAYKKTRPARGDIVAFTPLLDVPKVEKLTWCFRVFALPGEVVSAQEGKLLVNGKLITIPGQPKTTAYVTGKERPGISLKLLTLPYTVPETAYFLVGDNPDASNDSRFFGAVPFTNIKGKVEFE